MKKNSQIYQDYKYSVYRIHLPKKPKYWWQLYKKDNKWLIHYINEK